MAHSIKGKGLYPDKAGDFCGNHAPGGGLVISFHETVKEAERHHREYFARMRFGKPSSCSAGTSEEMVALGYIGLYLKEDRKLLHFETPIETDKLTEDYVSKAHNTESDPEAE